jgi:uncharacterized membrane protein (DUF4010 family)
MEDIELYQRLGLALGIGLVIGVERGWHTREESGGLRMAGVRTFALIGLLGGVWGLLSLVLGEVILGFVFLGFAALIIVGHVINVRSTQDYGITTLIAALLTFGLGVLAVRGDMMLAAAVAVVTVAVLDVKKALHREVRNLQQLELDAAIKLLLISVVMLPLLPDRGMGPGGALNPYELWWMVVLVAALSFVGYFTIKRAGPYLGIPVTGLFGGLASSTALTVSFARLGRHSPGFGNKLAGAIAIGAAVSFLRILVIVGVFFEPLTEALVLPLGLMTAAALTAAGVLLWRGGEGAPAEGGGEAVELTNPVEISMAVKFGVVLAGVVLLSHFVELWFGDGGLYGLAAVSGLTDVDAIALSLARLARGTLEQHVAVVGVVIAAMANTLTKAAIVAVLGDRVMATRLAIGLAGCLIAGGVGLLLV